jgi:hypothetical protein
VRLRTRKKISDSVDQVRDPAQELDDKPVIAPAVTLQNGDDAVPIGR